MQALVKRKIYHDFCQEMELPIFVHDWYLDVLCQSGQWDFAFVQENEKIVGVLPYFLKRRLGFRYSTMPLGVKYMGPFLAPAKDNTADQHRIYKQLIQQLPKVDSFRQNFHLSVTNWLPFYWENYQQTTQYTYRLNIENIEAVYRNFSDKTKYKLRKARKILKISDQLSAEQFHIVHQMTFNKQGLKTPLSLKDFLLFDKILAKHQARKMFFAVDKEQNIHAVLYIVLDKDIGYMHFMGSNLKFRKSEAITFLYWHAFQYLNENKIFLIDFEGSMMMNVENICRRLRAVQTPYFSITKEDSKLFKLIEKIRS